MVFKLIVVCCFVYFPLNCHGQREAKETHFPGYHFCGPGTNYLERITRGQVGINKLDEACRLHDLVYTYSTDLKLRMEADVKLEMQAWERVTANDSGYKEKIAAWMVTNVMKVKRKWNNRSLRKKSINEEFRIEEMNDETMKKRILLEEHTHLKINNNFAST